MKKLSLEQMEVVEGGQWGIYCFLQRIWNSTPDGGMSVWTPMDSDGVFFMGDIYGPTIDGGLQYLGQAKTISYC